MSAYSGFKRPGSVEDSHSWLSIKFWSPFSTITPPTMKIFLLVRWKYFNTEKNLSQCSALSVCCPHQSPASGWPGDSGEGWTSTRRWPGLDWGSGQGISWTWIQWIRRTQRIWRTRRIQEPRESSQQLQRTTVTMNMEFMDKNQPIYSPGNGSNDFLYWNIRRSNYNNLQSIVLSSVEYWQGLGI